MQERKSVNAYIVSAFSKNGTGGNMAGIVPYSEYLSREEKQSVAAILGFSETVFLSESDIADYKLEYFTPVDEVPMCGHATIAAFVLHALFQHDDRRNFTIETKSGILRMHITPDGMVFMEQNLPKYLDILPNERLENCVNPLCVEESLPVQVVSTGLPDILLPVKSEQALMDLNPDFEKMTTVSRGLGVVGMHAFTLTERQDADAVCRNFAPLYGINEESATGTASCALACYLYRHVKRKENYVFEQGEGMGLPSRIIVHLVADEENIRSVNVGGNGYLVAKKEIILT